jgi:hypothetical protein
MMKELISRVDALLASDIPIFREDLAIDRDGIKEAGVPPGPIYKEIFTNLLGITYNDPSKNTKEWLQDFVKRQYVDKGKQ